MSAPTKQTTYKPLNWQIPAWKCKDFTMLLTGAAGGGKSRCGLERLHAQMLKYPNSTGIMGRKDRSSANKSIVPFMRYTVQGDTDWGVYKKTDNVFEYNNGSQLWVFGMKGEDQREALRSIGKTGAVDFALLEEANKFSEDDYQEVIGRMRGTAAGWQQITLMTNPDAPNHWIKKRLIDAGEAAVFYSRPEDNPYNPKSYIENLQKLTGVFRLRMWEGKWVQAEGAVYPEYDVAKHLVDYKDFWWDKTGRHIVAIDFGYTNAFVASLYYIDRDGKMYNVKEVYMTNRIVEDHVPAIKRMIQDVKVEAWICDHDAEDRATLEKHLKITTIPAMKSVMMGISAVKQRLNEERLFFVRGAVDQIDQELEMKKKPTATIDEIDGYRWSDKKQDTPVKEDDHGVDACRYGIAYIDKVGQNIIEIQPHATIERYT